MITQWFCKVDCIGLKPAFIWNHAFNLDRLSSSTVDHVAPCTVALAQLSGRCWEGRAGTAAVYIPAQGKLPQQCKPSHITIVWSNLYPGHMPPFLSCPGRVVPILVKSWSRVLQDYFQVIELPGLSDLETAPHSSYQKEGMGVCSWSCGQRWGNLRLLQPQFFKSLCGCILSGNFAFSLQTTVCSACVKWSKQYK